MGGGQEYILGCKDVLLKFDNLCGSIDYLGGPGWWPCQCSPQVSTDMGGPDLEGLVQLGQAKGQGQACAC